MAGSKRKRAVQEQHEQRGEPAAGPDFSEYIHAHADNDMELAEALTQHNNAGSNLTHSRATLDEDDENATDTASAALNFELPSHDQNGSEGANFLVQTPPVGQADPNTDPHFDIDEPGTSKPDYTDYTIDQDDTEMATNDRDDNDEAPATEEANPAASNSPTATRHEAADDNKPKVGSEEWHSTRRNAHKIVERRRREAINDGINELGKIVTTSNRNKGDILQAAAKYIRDLNTARREAEEKNNLEKIMFQSTVQELEASGDRLKAEVRKLEKEVERWRRLAIAAGVKPDGERK